MKIDEILKQFVKECSEKLNLMSIIQFGSSTHSKNSDDIDLILFFNDEVISSEDYVDLLKIVDKFENKYKDLVFDIGAGMRIRQARYKISLVPMQKLDLKLSTDPFFANNIYKDKDKKILFGNNPFSEPITMSKRDLASRILLQVNWSLREALDTQTKNNAINFLLKSVLRYMLSNENVSRKQDLLKIFKKSYPSIYLPMDFDRILEKNIIEGDLKEILDFIERCVNFLVK